MAETFKSSLQNFQVLFGVDIQEKNTYLLIIYLGPGTRLDIRLNENNNPKVGEEPINAIDHLAYIHDLAYQKSDNISDRHKADTQMIYGLKQLKNLSIPQRLIRAMIIKLLQTKLKLGQGSRAAKTQAIEKLYTSKGEVSLTTLSPKELRQSCIQMQS